MSKAPYWAPEYAVWFQDPELAAVYHYRPAYPPQVFQRLLTLIQDEPRAVLDVGCGTGDICRPLAPSVDRIDAVDFSHAMISAGQALPGGNGPNLVWIEHAAETAPLSPPYALITAGESIHWMDWDVVLPRFAAALSPLGVLAIIQRNWDGPAEVCERLTPVFREYAAKEMNMPFDLIQGLVDRGFVQMGQETTEAAWRPTPDEYIECRHAQNSFSRRQMGATATVFDTALRTALASMVHDGTIISDAGHLQLTVRATVTWGTLRP